MTKTVGDILVETLDQAGVKQIFGIVGDSLNAITDSILRQKTIRWVHTRHEEAAAFAAGAEAQLTGKLAVCAGSCGPGNLHLINGLYECHRNRVPVLAIAAHIPSLEIGGNYFQETQPHILFKGCSDFCELVSMPEQMPRMLNMAIQTAINKKGVAVLVLPGTVALSESSISKNNFKPSYTTPTIVPSDDELKKIADYLNQSNNITILCGAGCRGAHHELMALCNQLQSPIVHALRGKEFIEYDNPYDVGMTGFIGFSSGYYAMESCDTLLLLGTSFPYRQFYPKNARVIQVDIRGEQLGLRCDLDVGVVGDVQATIRALLPLLKKHPESKHLNQSLKHYQKTREELDTLATGKAGQKVIHPQYVVKQLSEMAADDAIFTCDVGTPTLWAARYLKMNGKRRLLGSFNHGSMANALSQAIGAQIAFPDTQVIALCGDGGFAMLMGDFITLTQEKLPIKVVIINNGSLGFVEMEMKATGFLNMGTHLENPNFANMSAAMGIQSVRVEDAGDVEKAIKQALQHPGPFLIDMVTNRMELAMPPKITMEQARGFSAYLIKAVLSGRGDEVIELAKTNFWR